MFFVTTFMYFKPLSDKTQFRHNAIFLKSISGDTKISTLNFETEIETLLNHYSGLSLGHNLSLYKYEFKGNESDWIKSMVLKGALKAFLNEKIDISANINMDFQEVGPDKKKEFNPQTTIKIMLEYDII